MNLGKSDFTVKKYFGNQWGGGGYFVFHSYNHQNSAKEEGM